MKPFLKSLALLFILNCVVLLAPQRVFAQNDQQQADPNQGGGNYEQPNDQVFYDNLAPDGQWVNHPNYGYVWIPNAEPDFAPYRTGGHWVLTDYGWTWVSDYRWGWACFHYGRWEMDPMYGWLWLPGHEWAPAWVSWRSSPGYYGWAPMGYNHTVEMVYGGNYHVDNDRWVFVDERYVNDPYCSRYYVSRENNYVYVNNGSYIDNRYNDHDRNVVFIAGPRREDVVRSTGREVNTVVIRNSQRPGQTVHENNQLSIYRPAIQKPAQNQQRPAPRNTIAMNQVKPVTQRNTEYQQQHPEYKSSNVNNTQVQHSNNVGNSGQQQHVENNQQNTQVKQNTGQNVNQQHAGSGNVNQGQHTQQQSSANNHSQQGSQQYSRGNYNTKTNKLVPSNSQQKTQSKTPAQPAREKEGEREKK
jgi:uncharacterized protein DUF6600